MGQRHLLRALPSHAGHLPLLTKLVLFCHSQDLRRPAWHFDARKQNTADAELSLRGNGTTRRPAMMTHELKNCVNGN